MNLMLSTMLLLLRLATMPALPEQKAPAPPENVTYLDLSGPSSEPESDLPAITKKGPL